MKFLLLLFALPALALAQHEPCGLRTMTESAAPVYPPIARAAHVEGNVIMLVSFKTSGKVESIKVVGGSKFLESSAKSYVGSWHANEYSGPRTCPIVVRYRLGSPSSTLPNQVLRDDLQHVTVIGGDLPSLDVMY